jgi:hypothetical protein
MKPDLASRGRAGVLLIVLALIGGTGCVTARMIEGGTPKQQAGERGERERQEQERARREQQQREGERKEKTS